MDLPNSALFLFRVRNKVAEKVTLMEVAVRKVGHHFLGHVDNPHFFFVLPVFGPHYSEWKISRSSNLKAFLLGPVIFIKPILYPPFVSKGTFYLAAFSQVVCSGPMTHFRGGAHSCPFQSLCPLGQAAQETDAKTTRECPLALC